MTKKRKRLIMTVDVTVPVDMTASEAKRELRDIVNYQNTVSPRPDGEAIKLVRVSAKREVKAA